MTSCWRYDVNILAANRMGSSHNLTFLRLNGAATAAPKSLQSCLTLCDPTHGSPPGSPVPGILQARTLEWVAIAFSNAWKWKVKVKSLSLVQLFATPWTATYQAPASIGFSRQEYWSGVPFPSPSNWECDIQIQCSEKGDRVWSLMTPWIVYFCKSLMWEKKYLHV